MLVLRAQDVAALDAAAAEAGLPPDALMARAGRAVAGLAVRVAPAARRVAVLCGPGNNGGDGYVAAAELARRGRDVDLYEVTDAPRTAAAAAARAALAALPAGASARLRRRPGAPTAADLADTDLVVDALLGAGRSRPVAGALALWLDAVAAAGRPVLAVDVPSGLDADRAGPDGPVVHARWTLQLSAAKPAAFLEPARSAFGAWSVDDLGLPAALVARHATARAWDAATAGAALPRRAADAHKYRAGAVLVVAGSTRYPGAAALASRAALRAGAGYVACAGPARDDEVVRLAWAPSPNGARGLLADPLARRAHALVVGPGLEADTATLAALLAATTAPVVLDGGALDPDLEPAVRAHGRAVLTPHAGEAARWLGRGAAEVAVDPLAAAAELAARSGAVVVLKGPGTVVATPDGALELVPPGPAALATAGAGDVLAGLLGAVLAAAASAAATDAAVGDRTATDAAPSRSTPTPAAVAALAAAVATWHAEAARLAATACIAASEACAAAQDGPASVGRAASAGLTAGDVADALPAARAALEAAAARAAALGPRPSGC